MYRAFRSLIPPLLWFVGTIGAQVPAGHVLATRIDGSASARTGLAFFEPLRGALGAVGNVANQPWSLRRAVVGATRNDVLLGVELGDGTPTILSGRLAGAQLVSAQAFSGGLRGTPTGLTRLGDGRVIVCTTHTVFWVSAAGGPAMPVINTAVPLGCVDLAVTDRAVVVLGVDTSGPAPLHTLYEIDPVTLVPTAQPIALPGLARSLAFAPAQNGYLVGDMTGTLHLIDSRYVTSVWLATGLGPIVAMTYNSDQKNHSIATPSAVHQLAGQRIEASVGFPNTAAIPDLDYAPYTSSFSAYGTGCPGTNGQNPQIDALGRPFPGNTSFALTVTNAPRNAPAAVFVGFQPLNFDLAFLGMLGCSLLLNPDFDLPASTTNDTGLRPFPVPTLASLAGQSAFFQWFIIDPGANGLGVVTSDGGRAVF